MRTWGNGVEYLIFSKNPPESLPLRAESRIPDPRNSGNGDFGNVDLIKVSRLVQNLGYSQK